jgi:tol-pal system protein YbgF
MIEIKVSDTMIRKLFPIILLLPTILLSACSSTPVEEEPVPVVVQPAAPQNQEILRALNQLNDIKQELKGLRNIVEELQFETENSKRRQQDLFQDLDRRLVDIERNQSVLAPQVAEGTLVDPNTGAIIAGAAGTAGAGTTGTGVEPAAGSATQVVVVAPENSSGASATQGTTSSTGSDAAITPATGGSVSLEEQNAYEQSFELLKQSRYEDAILGFQQLVDTWPNSQLADDAYYWMSEARYVNREFEYALSGFRTVVTRYPDSQRVPEALLKVGYIQYDIGAYEDAAETFRDILARFPGHQVTVSAQTKLRRIEQTIQ